MIDVLLHSSFQWTIEIAKTGSMSRRWATVTSPKRSLSSCCHPWPVPSFGLSRVPAHSGDSKYVIGSGGGCSWLIRISSKISQSTPLFGYISTIGFVPRLTALIEAIPGIRWLHGLSLTWCRNCSARDTCSQFDQIQVRKKRSRNLYFRLWHVASPHWLRMAWRPWTWKTHNSTPNCKL